MPDRKKDSNHSFRLPNRVLLVTRLSLVLEDTRLAAPGCNVTFTSLVPPSFPWRLCQCQSAAVVQTVDQALVSYLYNMDDSNHYVLAERSTCMG